MEEPRLISNRRVFLQLIVFFLCFFIQTSSGSQEFETLEDLRLSVAIINNNETQLISVIENSSLLDLYGFNGRLLPSCLEIDASHRTPLHHAASNGTPQTVAFVLWLCPGLIKTPDREDRTPLDIVALRSDENIYNFMLLRNAAPEVLIHHAFTGGFDNLLSLITFQLYFFREVFLIHYRTPFLRYINDSVVPRLIELGNYYDEIGCEGLICVFTHIVIVLILMKVISMRNCCSIFLILLFTLFFLGFTFFSIVGIYWQVPIPAGDWEPLPLMTTCDSPKLVHGATLSRPSWEYFHHHGFIWKNSTICLDPHLQNQSICKSILDHPERCIFHTGDGGVRGNLPRTLPHIFKFIEASQVNFASVEEFLKNKSFLWIGSISHPPDLHKLSKLWDTEPDYRLCSNNCQHFVTLISSGFPVSSDLLQILPSFSFSVTLLIFWVIYVVLWYQDRAQGFRIVVTFLLQIVIVLETCAISSSNSHFLLQKAVIERSYLFWSISLGSIIYAVLHWKLLKLLPVVVLFAWHFHRSFPMFCWAVVEIFFNEIGTSIFGLMTLSGLLYYQNVMIYVSLITQGRFEIAPRYFSALQF